MAHFELPAGRRLARGDASDGRGRSGTSWSGRGGLWRRSRGAERIEALAPGVAVTIPLGTEFQFRAEEDGPLAFVAITMPPWPGMDEATAVEGPWAPTVAALRKGEALAPTRARC